MRLALTILHSFLAPLAAGVVILIGAAQGYIARQKRRKKASPNWLKRVDNHSWWALAGCGIVGLAVRFAPVPQSAAEIAEQRSVYSVLGMDCMDHAAQYAVRHSGGVGDSTIFDGTEGYIDFWQKAEKLPPLTYSEQEWVRLLPIFDTDYAAFSTRMRELLNGHQDALSPEFRALIQRTQQDIEHDVFNYRNIPNLIKRGYSAANGFDAQARLPITTLGNFCRAVQELGRNLPAG